MMGRDRGGGAVDAAFKSIGFLTGVRQLPGNPTIPFGVHP
jgi:hypothetical protein